MTAQTIPSFDVETQRRQGVPMRIIDVRTPAEFHRVHAQGAELFPLGRLDAAEFAGVEPTTPLYVICKSGSRAAVACERLRKAGLVNVRSVEGGTDAWERAGLAVVRGNRQ